LDILITNGEDVYQLVYKYHCIGAVYTQLYIPTNSLFIYLPTGFEIYEEKMKL